MTYILVGVGVAALLALALLGLLYLNGHRRRAALWRATLEDPLCGAMLVLMRDEVGKEGMMVLDIVGLAVRKIPEATYRSATMTFAVLKAQGLIVSVGTSVPSGTGLFALSELGVRMARQPNGECVPDLSERP